MHDKTIVILTAMNLEYKAVQARLSGITVQTHPKGTRFEVGHLDNSDVRVALALAGKGNQPAAVITERAVSHFNPVAVIFVGVAGALQPHLALGDVVVANPVYAYHGATSEDDGTTARPRAWELSHRAHHIAAHVERDADWTRQLPEGNEPRVHFGPVAAGELALYSGASDVRRWLREHYNDALAVEMEAAGVAQAGHLNDGLPAIMVRGISDFADGTKSATDGDGWQPRAAANAATFAAALAGELAKELDGSSAPGATGPQGASPFNLATGNARVGFQGQNVTINGDIQLGGHDKEGGTTARMTKAEVRPGKLSLILNGSLRFFRNLADLAAGAAAIITAIRTVA
ncbi:MAG: purine phosphorylase [Trebonia sp.]